MRIEDSACRAEGFVEPRFVNQATGESVGFDRRHNMLSYMSAEAMAAAFGGDVSYVPARIGFIYSYSGKWTSEEAITRNQSWDQLKEELAGKNADIQVVGFSYSPSLGGEGGPGCSSDSGSSGSSSSSGDDGSDYDHIKAGGANAVTFHAVSNSSDAGAAGNRAFTTNDYIYQAVLLGYHDGEYYVLSRVSLKDGDYRQKPNGFEVAIDWTVVFH